MFYDLCDLAPDVLPQDLRESSQYKGEDFRLLLDLCVFDFSDRGDGVRFLAQEYDRC